MTPTDTVPFWQYAMSAVGFVVGFIVLCALSVKAWNAIETAVTRAYDRHVARALDRDLAAHPTLPRQETRT